MQSNSKISKFQKRDLKAFKAVNPELHFVSVPEFGVTFAFKATGPKGGQFSVALATTDEKKLRRKVGEFYALQRFVTYETLPINGTLSSIDWWSLAATFNASNNRKEQPFLTVFIDGIEQGPSD